MMVAQDHVDLLLDTVETTQRVIAEVSEAAQDRKRRLEQAQETYDAGKELIDRLTDRKVARLAALENDQRRQEKRASESSGANLVERKELW